MPDELELTELADAVGAPAQDVNGPRGARELEAVYDIPVTVSAVLGKATMQVSQLLKLGRGAVVELDRKLGEAIDIYVNNRLVARGEVVMVDDNRLGVTMTEIVKADRPIDDWPYPIPYHGCRMRILIIGSLAGELGHAARLAMARGAKLDQADDGEAGLTRLRGGSHVDLVLCDLAHDVGALVRALAAERIAIPIVACGVDPTADDAVRAIREGAREFLPLPPDADLIAAILQTAAGETHGLIVRDPIMAITVRRAEQVASAEASVLITGESGTGKEVLARHIHLRSRRAGGPFIALNCAAIPENLLESELFGHEKGAFSGAVARRIGKFEAADEGTLLLDEISEMDIRLQAKLLRALQEREIDRLGGAGPVRVNVRILATANRDLPAEVARGTFREDLYFRLNVVALRVPPLRERPGDIAALAAHFAEKYAEVNGVPYRALSSSALQRLTGHTWRGNVRELENTVHRAVLLASGAMIEPDAIELSSDAGSGGLRSSAARAGPGAATTVTTPQGGGATGIASLVGQRMEDVERNLILQTLGHTLGNRTHAAIILGISIRALRNKLRDYAAQGAPVPPPPAGVAVPLPTGADYFTPSLTSLQA